MFSIKEMPSSASSIFSAYASFAASMMLIHSLTNQLFPPQLTSFLSTIWVYFFGNISSNTTLIIDEYSGFIRNEVFEAVEIYLRTKISPSTDILKVSKTPRQNKVTFSIEKGQEVIDHFENIRLKWRIVSTQGEPAKGQYSQEDRHFELIFGKKYRDRIVDYYLPFVMKRVKEIKDEEKVIKIYSPDIQFADGVRAGAHRVNWGWGSINLDHPATFDTLAMNPELKKFIIDDLNRFVKRKDFYKKVGKAWKRGYLLYGPPGTGKSSLIAAIANYLKFDIYDLDFSNLDRNSDLKKVLLSSKNRSIVVIEDIDCSCLDLNNRESVQKFNNSTNKFTLSGMLNFIDGLWSSCGDERIIIFTTNHIDRLDPALLRPGRMDVHINMSYCTSQGFKVLASNYLGDGAIRHCLYREIEELIDSMEVSPAEIAEELMKSDDVDVVLGDLAEFLKHKKEKDKGMGDKME